MSAPASAVDIAGSTRWRQRVRRFAEDRIRHRSDTMDRAARIDDELRGELFDEGLMSVEIPRDYGGSGAGLTEVAVTIEELSRVDPGVAVLVDVHNALLVASILRMGGGDLKRRFLPGLARQTVGAYALSEADAGSDALNVRTTATPVPGGFALDGGKRWTSGAGAADLFLVFARMADEHRRLSAFLVPREAPGLSVGPVAAQVGVRAAATAELTLDGVKVRAADALGGIGAGRAVAVASLDIGRLGIAAQLVGLAQGALEVALGHAGSREQFGSRIGEFQGVQFPIAAAATRVQAARALTYDAIRAVSAGVSPVKRMRLAAMAKLHAAEVAEQTARTALDVHGGAGYLRGHPAERLYRDAQAGTIYEGTTNILLRTVYSTLGAEAGA
ncbi:acyl-CoA dehydrogenase family protein [Micromonospora craniellae]|uniref:acyl-CoA dehydrogenase family protein n=1 Tax=Micromonospora craniellae TaxID=2294034 RepID=UPI0018F2400E|nr:acyl-CoA dehydrogenase family protein [Micromonospora craniellae]